MSDQRGGYGAEPSGISDPVVPTSPSGAVLIDPHLLRMAEDRLEAKAIGAMARPHTVDAEAMQVLRRSERMEDYCSTFSWPHERRIATAVLLRGAVIKRLREIEKQHANLEAIVSDVECYLENAGSSELTFDHVAHFLRQRGRAQGPEMDKHFAGTSLERRS